MELISKRTKPTENTTLQQLTIFDQIKVLIAHFNNTDARDLDAMEKLSAAELKKKAALNKLFLDAADSMKAKGSYSVTISVPSSFLPYFDEVTDSLTGLGRYYDFELIKNDLPIVLDYDVIVIMSRRVTRNATK